MSATLPRLQEMAVPLCTVTPDTACLQRPKVCSRPGCVAVEGEAAGGAAPLPPRKSHSFRLPSCAGSVQSTGDCWCGMTTFF